MKVNTSRINRINRNFQEFSKKATTDPNITKNNFYNSLEDGIKENDLIKNYPTVYIHNWEKSDKFEVYVGESNNFFQRTYVTKIIHDKILN